METFPLRRTSSPTWQYSFAVDAPSDGTEPVYRMVLDAEGDEIIGKKKVDFTTFVAKPGLVLEDLGSVELLELKVEPLGADTRATYKFNVDAKANIDNLAKEVDRRPRPGVTGDWRGVPVLNGDYVRIRATGTICPNSGPLCSGPEGVSPTRKKDWQSSNKPGFSGLYHAALVGMLAGKPLYVGRWLEFRVTTAGMLLLGVNDKDVGNSGGFQVEVEVNPPDLVAAGAVGPAATSSITCCSWSERTAFPLKSRRRCRPSSLRARANAKRSRRPRRNGSACWRPRRSRSSRPASRSARHGQVEMVDELHDWLAAHQRHSQHQPDNLFRRQPPRAKRGRAGGPERPLNPIGIESLEDLLDVVGDNPAEVRERLADAGRFGDVHARHPDPIARTGN
jgi:hypothetical protein